MLDTVQPELQNKTNYQRQQGKEKTFRAEENAGHSAARTAEQNK